MAYDHLMKNNFYIFITGAIVLFSLFSGKTSDAASDVSAHNFEFESLTSKEPLKLKQYKGKVLLIVNTASECGFTGQYEGLESLYNNYKDKGLVVIGVPSNDFGKQEPGSGEEIASFCKLNYGVSFPIAAKQIVKGDDAHPFYKWVSEELGFGSAPKWNFHKYLIDKNGNAVDFYLSNTKPESGKLIKAIEKLL